MPTEVKIGYGIKFFVTVSDWFKNLLDGKEKIFMPVITPWMRMIDRTRLVTTTEEGVTLEWVTSDGKPGPLTIEVLMPTLNKWAEAKRAGKLEEVFPLWKRFQKLNGPFVKMVEEITLKWGVINGVLIDDPDIFKVIADYLMLSWTGIDKVNALRAFSKEETRESFTWLFQPGETAHLSPFAQMARERRGACGTIVLEAGCLKLEKLPQPLMGEASLIATKGGHPNWMEPQGKSIQDLSCVGAGPNEWEVILPEGLGSKVDKRNARPKLPLANTCRSQGTPIQSNFFMNNLPTAEGWLERVALTTYESFIFGDGGCLTRKGKVWKVIESHTYTIQLPPDTLVSKKVGDLIKVGESLIGVDNMLLAEYEGKLINVTITDVEGIKVVKVKQELLIMTMAPKFRAPGIKASAHPDLLDLLAEYEFDILLPVKASVAFLKMFCDDTGIKINLTPSCPGMPDDLKPVYAQWLQDHTKSVTFRWPISHKIADIAEAIGLKVVRESRRINYLERTIQVVVGNTVLEIESPIPELRMTSTSLTMITALEIESVCGIQGTPVPVPVFAPPDELLTMEHCEKVVELGYKEGLKYLTKQYPKGFLLRNGAQYVVDNGGTVNESIVGVDPKAVLAFTSGEIQAEDAVGMTLWNSLRAKSAFNLVIAGFEAGVNSIKLLENASAGLGQKICWLQSSINHLAVTGAVLKRLVNSQRIAVLGTARAYDFIPTEKVWMSQKTLDRCRELARYQDPNLDTILGRHPTALFYGAEVEINEDVPFGIFALNTLAVGVADDGDVDGDQKWMLFKKLAPFLYGTNFRERELASRLICMMAWNAGIELPDTEPGKFSRVSVKLPSYEGLWEKAMRNYTRHTSDLEHSPFAKSLKGSDLASKAEFLDAPLPAYNANEYPHMSMFGTVGIGRGYALLLNSHILAKYAKTPKEQELFEAAFAIGQDIYEKVMNAGYNADRYLILEALLKPASDATLEERVVSLRAALTLNGMQINFPGLDEKLVYYAILMANNVQHGVQGRKVELFGYEDMVPVVKALRGLSSGDKRLIVTPEEWEHVCNLTLKGNPYFEIIHSIADIYTILAMVHALRQQEEQGEDNFDI
jgi:hypothetical protein